MKQPTKKEVLLEMERLVRTLLELADLDNTSRDDGRVDSIYLKASAALDHPSTANTARKVLQLAPEWMKEAFLSEVP